MMFGPVFYHLEVPMNAKVNVPWLACCNFVIMVIITFLGLGYSLFVEKNYLEKCTISGVARTQVQHPVDKCNPLQEGCGTKFAHLEDLQQYCLPRGSEGGQCVGNRCACRYLDEFDVVQQSDVEQRHLFLPTKVTKYHQDILCDGDCAERYKNTLNTTFFVADIESFTVLLDHAFVVDKLGMEKRASELQGFAKYNEHKESDRTAIQKFGDSPITKATEEQLIALWETTKYDWNAGEKGKGDAPLFTIPSGDVFTMGHVLDRLEVDLDKQHDFGQASMPATTLRHSGFILMVDIDYHNWKEWSIPNALPPIYDISFNVVTKTPYKVTGTFPGLTDDPKKRIIEEKNGILIVVKQGGNIGKMSTRLVILIFIEMSLLIGFGKFVLLCCAINVLGDGGKPIEDGVAPEIPHDGSNEFHFGETRIGEHLGCLMEEETSSDAEHDEHQEH